MSNDPTITISIGTPNNADAPGYLRDDQWQAFKDDVRDAFRSLSADGAFHYRGEGYGQYRDETGKLHEELSYTLVFTLHQNIPTNDVRRKCAFFAAEYGQECIALTIGDTELVGPEPNAAAVVNEVCDNCGSPLVVVRSREGRFCTSECAEAFELS